MIIAYNSVFGYANIIVFQLAERIALAQKSMKSVSRKCIDMLGFSYNAIPTRHEVHVKPYLQEDKIMIDNKPTKLQALRIWRIIKLDLYICVHAAVRWSLRRYWAIAKR